MFSNLVFSTKNSLNTPVTLSVFHDSGIISYEVLLPNLGVVKAKRVSLSKSESSKFIREIRNQYMEQTVTLVPQETEPEEGNEWSLDVEIDGKSYSLNGPAIAESRYCRLLESLCEIFDRYFVITQFVNPNRVDKIEIDFLYNEFDNTKEGIYGEERAFNQTEYVSLDRSSSMINYSRSCPHKCFHSSLECYNDDAVREILNETTRLFSDDMFHDVATEDSSPRLRFHFTFHDGRTEEVFRNLSEEGLVEYLYGELIDVIGVTIGDNVLIGGLFDPSFRGGEIHLDEDGNIVDSKEKETQSDEEQIRRDCEEFNGFDGIERSDDGFFVFENPCDSSTEKQKDKKPV